MRTPACLTVLLLAARAMAQEGLPTDASIPPAPEVDASLRAAASSPALLEAMNNVLRAPMAERPAAVESLASLADDRAVPLLGYVARFDSLLAARTSAAAALGAFQTEEAVAVAGRLLEEARLPSGVREAAASSLGRQASPASLPLLDRVARDADEIPAVREASREALRAGFPEAFAALTPPVRAIDRSGRTLGTVTGALSGAYTLGLVGALSPGGADAATVLGVMGGLVVGGVGANLYARDNGLSS
ncbi:MAG: hypothetical protein RL199_2450, partial [Pseudomonadota bacterium]